MPLLTQFQGRLAYAWLPLLFLGCGDAKPESDNAAIELACSKACVIALQLKCAAEQDLTDVSCNARCMSLYRAYPDCQSEYLALTQCVGAEPAANWGCDASGQANVTNGFCQAEYDVLKACM